MSLEQALSGVGVDTARRLAKVDRLIARRTKADADLVDSLLRILESQNPQAEWVRQLIKECYRSVAALR